MGRQGLILHTTDGGATWVRQASGTEEPLLAVDFVDERHGWAVGNFLLVLRTIDGGATWESTLAPAPSEDELMEGAPGEPVLNAVAFVDEKRGWVFGEFGTIATTTDGGQRWTLQERKTTQTLFGATFWDARHGAAVGSSGTVLETSDGGATWTATSVGTEQPLLHAARAGQKTWACGRAGLLVSGAAGAYAVGRAGTYDWLAAIAFGDDGSGLAVGGAGTVLRTTDGGATWAVLPVRR